MELSIDTATQWASLALSRRGEVWAELAWRPGRGHVAELFPGLGRLLALAGLGPRELRAVNVAQGPGHFNGVRVGVAAAKGLALALDIPVVGVSTLELEAYPYAPSHLPICPLLDAGRGDVMAALFRQGEAGWQRLREDQVLAPEALCRRVRGRTIFCGQISPEVEAMLVERLGGRALVARGAARPRRAGYLAELGWQRQEKGEAQDAASLQAVYLRQPAVTLRRRS